MPGETKLSDGHYFAQVLAGLDRPERLEAARRAGLKTIAVVGVALPEELFWACHAAPVSIGQFVADVGAAGTAAELPRDVCAGARTGYALLARRWIPAGLIDAVVVAGGCDWTARLGDRLEGRVPIWPLNVSRAARPFETGCQPVLQQVVGSLEAMLGQLEILTDLPLTGRAFAAAQARAAALAQLCGRLDRLRAETPPSLFASGYYRMVGALELSDPDHWFTEVEALLENPSSIVPGFQSAIRNPQSAIGATAIDASRIVLCGCPSGFPDASLIELIERAGFQIVGEDFGAHRGGTDSGPASSAKTVRLPRTRRGILNWISQTLVVGSAHTEPRDLWRLVNERRADGVIRIHYRGCAADAMDALRLEPELAARGIPHLAVEVEQLPAATEALRTRLEAFREQLKAAHPA